MNVLESVSFDKLKLQTATVRSGTWIEKADDRGYVTDEVIDFYSNLSGKNIGLVVVGYARISENEQANSQMIGAFSDDHIEGLSKLAAAIKSDGITKAGIQIAMGGNQTKYKFDGHKIFAPSTHAHNIMKTVGEEATIEELKEIQYQFVQAAKIVKEAGFDVVVLHAAHGYLLSQFMSPYANSRTDEYGGSVENRSRMLLETINKIDKETNGFPIAVKINASDLCDNGATFEDTSKLVELLNKQRLLEYIELSSGVPQRNINNTPSKKEMNSAFMNDKMHYYANSKIPLIPVGGINTMKKANQILENGANAVSISRALISEPDLISKWISNSDHQPRCVSCNYCHKKTAICIHDVKLEK